LKAKIINLVEILINSLPIQGKALPFAMESSQGIREEGMTTLSRQLDPSPRVSVPGWICFVEKKYLSPKTGLCLRDFSLTRVSVLGN